jgi:hypothetical protein
MVKSFYRREPVVSFAVTIGAVDTVLGGVSQHFSLLWFGLGLAGVVVALRWWQTQQAIAKQIVNSPPAYFLPPQSSSSSLPMLSIPKKSPPEK